MENQNNNPTTAVAQMDSFNAMSMYFDGNQFATRPARVPDARQQRPRTKGVPSSLLDNPSKKPKHEK